MRSEIDADSPDGQLADVLKEAEKGEPVNVQDLVNALWWRVRNQKTEIARLHAKREPASREIRTIDDVAAICHSVTGLCCHILGSPGGPCTINNCAAVRGYLGGPEFGEPASREAFDGLHKAGCAALELPHGRRSHCNCGAVKSGVSE